MQISRIFLGISLFAFCTSAMTPAIVTGATNHRKPAETATGNPAAEPTVPLASGVVWDLSGFFPTFQGPEMKNFCEALRKDLAQTLPKAKSLKSLSLQTLESWLKIIQAYENISARSWHFSAYLGALTAGDARNEDFQAETAQDELISAEMQKLETEIKRGLRDASPAVTQKLSQRPEMRDAEHMISRWRESARRTMTTPEETLAADLGVDALSAWGRMYDQIAGKLEFAMVYPDGRRATLPITEYPILLQDPDRRVREAAFHGASQAWEKMIDPCTHALNHICGLRLTLNRHRGIQSLLDNALFESDMKPETLTALLTALRKNIEIPRSMARAKARSLGLKALSWWDQDAPLANATEPKSPWLEGTEMVRQAFASGIPEMADLLKEMKSRRFYEAEIRAGKAPGAFCTDSPLLGESRIFLSYGGGLSDLYTVAHETGHAYHNLVMKDLRPLSRIFPNTLAETASTFGELLFTHGLLNDPKVSPQQKAAVLNMEMNNAVGYLLDVPCRYSFEAAFTRAREKGEVSSEKLSAMMQAAQKEYFGEALSVGGDFPLFWIAKGHFYFTDSTYYNFPYTFGFLLSRGLFAQFLKEGPAFLPKYREFLRQSGRYSVEEVAEKTLGVDLTKPAFWEEAIKSLVPYRTQFENIVLQKP